MNGVDLIQVGRFTAHANNAADIQMTVDAMETLIVHREVAVCLLVTGDSDFTSLVRRLREFGKWVVGVAAEANASRRLVSVSSDYTTWAALSTARTLTAILQPRPSTPPQPRNCLSGPRLAIITWIERTYYRRRQTSAARRH